jgi:hypothetical protein
MSLTSVALNLTIYLSISVEVIALKMTGIEYSLGWNLIYSYVFG